MRPYHKNKIKAYTVKRKKQQQVKEGFDLRSLFLLKESCTGVPLGCRRVLWLTELHSPPLWLWWTHSFSFLVQIRGHLTHALSGAFFMLLVDGLMKKFLGGSTWWGMICDGSDLGQTHNVHNTLMAVNTFLTLFGKTLWKSLNVGNSKGVYKYFTCLGQMIRFVQ